MGWGCIRELQVKAHAWKHISTSNEKIHAAFYSSSVNALADPWNRQPEQQQAGHMVWATQCIYLHFHIPPCFLISPVPYLSTTGRQLLCKGHIPPKPICDHCKWGQAFFVLIVMAFCPFALAENLAHSWKRAVCEPMPRRMLSCYKGCSENWCANTCRSSEKWQTYLHTYTLCSQWVQHIRDPGFPRGTICPTGDVCISCCEVTMCWT